MDAARRGLEDVVVGESSISLVGGTTGHLSYRGYEISEVVGHLGYESTVHLLLVGTPPARDPPEPLARDLAGRRGIPAAAAAAIDGLAPSTPPMDALRTGLSALGGPSFEYPPTATQGLDLIAKAPTLLARFHRRRSGLAPVAPDPALGHVADFLRMVGGRPPTPRQVWALESYFDIVADHGMNASTFALRVVLSTNSDLISGATAGVGALKGPLHGGAPQKVLDMLDAVGAADAAETWVRAALARKERLMGFGHRVYKVQDPRAELLRGIARTVAAPDRFALAHRLEEVALRELRAARPDQKLYTNVEFYAALVLEAVGLPRDLFPPTFAVARTAGWAAHAVEQAANNRLIRPEVDYTGPRDRHFGPDLPARTAPA